MFGNTDYHQSIRKLVVAFGTMFNNVIIEVEGQDIVVPLSYSPRQRFVAKMRQAQSGNAEIGLTLPRMAFEISNLSYDSSRKLNTLQPLWINRNTDSGESKVQFQRVPYNVDFTLIAMVRETEEGLQIVEKILPYFAPEMNIPINDAVQHDVPITLNSTSFQDDYENDLQGVPMRTITWNFDFTCKTYLYHPTREGKIILEETTTFELGDI